MSQRRRGRPAAPRERLEIAYSFGFDAAHHFERMPSRHRYRTLHGHSFRAEVVLAGEPKPPHGFIADFGLLEKACAALRDRLDHRLLNTVPALGAPSLENLARWIYARLARRVPGIVRVTVRRESLGQSCTYFGTG